MTLGGSSGSYISPWIFVKVLEAQKDPLGYLLWYFKLSNCFPTPYPTLSAPPPNPLHCFVIVGIQEASPKQSSIPVHSSPSTTHNSYLQSK